ncbi:unnamed protein product [Rotaria magnacalcarata]|uniref:Glutaminase n=4 Tax=Rotaria magnacalcarata TaxID=392030 RepID=A0A815J6V7_9BILA|nr:unnamed protein product [Rotaria magnacalcarata]
MQPRLLLIHVICLLAMIRLAKTDLVKDFRPPATPLLLLNPTIQVWSKGDRLNDVPTSHWIESQNMSLVGLIRINNGSKILRFMGVTDESIEPMKQIQVRVQPTQTLYVFQSEEVELNLTFIQPAFMHSLELSSLPLGYLIHSVRSLSSEQEISVQIYIEISADFVVNSLANDQVVWEEARPGEHRWQSYSHAPFQTHGDRIKPDWGYFYVASRSRFLRDSTQVNASLSRQAFIQGTFNLPQRDDSQGPRSVQNGYPASSFQFDYGQMNQNSNSYSSFLVLFHDEQLSINFFSNYQRPYWTKIYTNAQKLLDAAFQRFSDIQDEANQYDKMLIDRYTNVAGDEYATLLSLVHRQVTGACVTVWNDERQEAWSYMKEQSSDGDVSTVDVISPAAPFFLTLGPEYLRRLILPLLAYSNNETYVRYKLPWTPHHLGDWPVCSILSQEQEQMPMEETGNMLILLAAIAQRQSKQIDYLQPYAPLLQSWADYLNDSLPDPENQLCTDDFEGSSAHNANLALKGIIGLGAYSILLSMGLGNQSQADVYMKQAVDFAYAWTLLDWNGQDHFRLQYNASDSTWSQKYNMFWSLVIGLDDVLFGELRIRDIELAYYEKKMNRFGLPLDSRGALAKLDSSMWIAAMTRGNTEQRQQIIDNLYTFAHSTPTRIPLSDLYDTTTNEAVYFTARPVLGGLYALDLLAI